MFKKEINFISDLNLNKLQVIGDRFTVNDLTSSRIHPAILHFINATIDKEIFSDRKKIENNSIFDYKTDRINNYFIFISEEIKKTQHFDLKYLKQIVQNAIVFNINFLSSPNKTLIKLIFGDHDVKTIEEIVLGVSHAYYYRYLQKILLTYLDKKKVISLSKEEFSQLLERIDKISRDTHLEDTLVTAVNSMTNFFDQNSRTSEMLPITAIQLYLEEKKLYEFSTKLENSFITESTTHFIGRDVINVLRSVTPESEIVLAETSRIEDQLIEDKSNNQEITSGKSEEEVDLLNDEIHLNNEDIFEVSEDEIDIPNNEILSNDEIVDDEDFDELAKNDTEQLESEKMNEEKNDSDSDEIQKKKINGIKILSELIDLNPLYESLLTDLKPFEKFENSLNLIKTIKKQSAELNYQIDLSTLNDKLDLYKKDCNSINTTLQTDDLEYSTIDDKPLENYDESEIIEIESIEFGNNIDNMVKDSKNEKEFLQKDEFKNDLISDEKDENEMKKMNDENFAIIDEENDEITEVFKDLTFLDNLDNLENINRKENRKDESIFFQKENHESRSEDTFNINNENDSGFIESLLTKDMSKIIELIFDYDMEEYYSIINKISLCNSEEDSNLHLEEYCQLNNLETNSKEVESFKSMISDFFTNTYS